MKPPHPTPSGTTQSWEGGPGRPHLPHPGAVFSALHAPCLDRTIRAAEQCRGDGPLSALGVFPWSMQPLPPPSAGYQGSFHSIQSCFPYGDCYQTAEPAASGDSLAGEAHSFNPLRPNGYHSLSAPLPTTGEPSPCMPPFPGHLPRPSPVLGYLCTLS